MSSMDEATKMQERIKRWRSETPGCATRNHLNNAGAGLMPDQVLSACTDHLRLEGKIGGYETGRIRLRTKGRQFSAPAATPLGAGAVALTPQISSRCGQRVRRSRASRPASRKAPSAAAPRSSPNPQWRNR